ncbi:unnamed protein product [Peronospora belbahrii]|uniref:Uncharacterized protein n=1 Tax=Peronospora belbahrii TaxID=622444 RepID=A0AAU9KU71_9STRA|nr:unnamed protein product [Peronospora belbahrii]
MVHSVLPTLAAASAHCSMALLAPAALAHQIVLNPLPGLDDRRQGHQRLTDPEGTPRPIPSKRIFRTTGYTHNGPCAVYLNKKLVLDGEDCHTQYPGKDHIIDYSSCKQKCLLRWYWLGIRQIKGIVSWQVYKAIIPLTAEKPSSKEK